MSSSVSSSPPRAPPIQYNAPNGTRWAKEKAAAGGDNAFTYPEDPARIGPWILGECVGKGASGRVKIAKHHRTGELAAVKILPLQPLVNSRASFATQQAKNEKQRLGIDREIIMMKLMNHPNIMRIYDVFEGDKDLYLVLEYVEGGELFDLLVNKGRLKSHDALAYFKQIVYALAYAHTFSIIHRDLKPENILIKSLNPPLIKIADWGMAAFAPPALQLETSCGSPHYASPEIVNGSRYEGGATDIWSCGVILFALLTGRLPFDDKNIRTLLGKVKLGKYEVPSYVDPQARDLLNRMLVVDVSQRITMDGILAHPWFLNHTPAVRYVAAPSMHELARPLRSHAHIDNELLESLRIIWGRYGGTEDIVADLLSPAGQGTLAKAFYFLLQEYRNQTLLEDSIEDANRNPSLQVPGYAGTIAVSRQRSLRSDITPTPTQRNMDVSMLTSSRIAPPPPVKLTSSPQSSTTSTESTSSHARSPPPPSGPRAPRSRPQSAFNPIRANTDPTQSSRISAKSEPNQQLLWPPPAMATRSGSRTPSPLPLLPFPEISPMFESRNPSCTTTIPPVPAPTTIASAPVSPMHVVMDLPDFQKQGDGSIDMDINEELPTPTDHEYQIIQSSQDKRRSQYRGVRRVHDKENHRVAAGAVFPNDGHPAGRKIGKDVGNVAFTEPREPEVMKAKKDRRSRPAPLDFSDQNQKAKNRRSAFNIIGSSNVGGSSTVGTPVGEMKGWFSNLFNFRQQHYVLGSQFSTTATREEMHRLLGQLGVAVVSENATLRCRLDDLRFRVEFTLGPAVSSSGPTTPNASVTPRASQFVHNTVQPIPLTCVACLYHERGSATAYRTVWRQMRNLWRFDGGHAQSLMSPPLDQGTIEGMVLV